MKSKETKSQALSLDGLRERLSSESGPRYWRSLDEAAQTPEFRQHLEREFPQYLDQYLDPANRRNFLKLMAASVAFGGLTGCVKQPDETIMPYAARPEFRIPGKPQMFATAFPLAGYAEGILVESHEGRPTKVEGNPDHPASLGATTALAQAAVLNLYDPDRSSIVTRNGRPSLWSTLIRQLRLKMEQQRIKGGAGLRIVTDTVSSPSFTALMEGLLADLPQARWIQWDPVNRDNPRDGARRAFGEDAEAVYRFARANVVLSLEADFLMQGPGTVRYTRDFVSRRKPEGEMNRLYVVESCPSATGATADHRLRLTLGQIDSFARAVAAELGVPGLRSPDGDLPEAAQRWVQPVARDLAQNRGAAIVAAGDHLPASLHALVFAINQALDSFSNTIELIEPVVSRPASQVEAIRSLATELEAGDVDALLILGANPAYNAPADANFSAAMEKAPFRLHLGHTEDETAALCEWHVPESHFLECWNDFRAWDGAVTIAQPLIAPLYESKSAAELVSAMLQAPGLSSHDIVKNYWRVRTIGAESRDPSVEEQFERSWRQWVHDGIVPDTAAAPKTLSLAADWDRPEAATEAGGIELLLRADPSIFDGRFANNGWLQEAPKPLTKITWVNAALMSPSTAQSLKVENGQNIRITKEERSVEAPAWVVPGHADNAITLALGYGRTRAGRVGNGVGSNAYVIRTSSQMAAVPGVEVRRIRGAHEVACTQDHHSMEGRNLIRHADLEQYHEHPDFAQEAGHGPKKDEGEAHSPPNLYPPYEYDRNAWGMAVDLNACVGCNACVVSCVSENNIAVVGEDQVSRGREMHWIRIDRYFEGSLDDPEIHHQPVMCQQCENAPCEPVCPVGATVHSSEGLNDMIYNRCVGTRYCSNNCPYKVRRFNFLLYSDFETPSLKLMRNPDVTVRSRGVMEKCTYCVQRINAARIEAEKEGRRIADGEVRTACQTVCPADAIAFGDINDPRSKVSQLKSNSRNYGLLTDLNTVPRTTYLAKVRNPNPELESAEAEA